MTDQLKSVALRLLEAGNPNDVKGWEQDDGYYVKTCRVSPDDSQTLVELARKWLDGEWLDEELGIDADIENLELLPVSAWRCLADMKDERAAKPLAEMLGDLDDVDDDWTLDEFPLVFGKIGKAAIEPLQRLLNGSARTARVRTVAAESLQKIAEYHPEIRDEVVGILKSFMSKAEESDVEVNSFAMWSLVQLRATEAAEEIERALAANRIDVSICGDWENIRNELGIESGLGLEMPQNPIGFQKMDLDSNSSVFCSRPIFGEEGTDSDAAEEYYDQVHAMFSSSPEGRQVIERNGHLTWILSLMEFGLSYLGETIDTMKCSSIAEFLFDHCPRKVSVEAEKAEAIVFELTRFWEYLDREFELEGTGSILQWLETPGLSNRLSRELSDSRNFGMAKSLVMNGAAAGFDMTTEAGINQYMAFYNSRIHSSNPIRNSKSRTAEPASYYDNTPVRVERIGRNESCPCGSGKKYKKCCLRGG